MGKSAPSAPPPPDPNVVSSAQTQSNRETALYNTGLNNVNQNTPLGSISYNINPNTQAPPSYNGMSTAPVNFSGGVPGGGDPGSYFETTTKDPSSGYYGVLDSNGKFVGWNGAGPTESGTNQTPGSSSGVPIVTSNVTLNPDVQHALTSSLQTKAGLADTTQAYLGRVNEGLTRPPPVADAAFRQKQVDNLTAMQAPFVQRQQQQLRAELAAKGVTEGSPAWHNAMMDESQGLNNQQQQNIANATGQEQAQFGMDTAAYTLPLNELSALQSGSQVQQPSFAAPQPVSVAPTNTAANTYASYNGQVANANSQQASQNQLMQSLFGLGGQIGGAYAGSTAGSAALTALFASDIRLKTNIRRIGATPGGIPVYEFFYKSGGPKQTGVMAHEVEKVIPEAVIKDPDGFKMVNYAMVR